MGARGLLMLRPIPTSTPDIMVLVTLGTVSDSDTMVMDSSMARGLLMLSLRPRLILTTLDTDMDLDTPDTSDMPDTLDMPDSDTAESSTANRLHQDLSVNHRLDLRQKWIVISLKFPSPVLQFQCYYTKSLVMVSRKQENRSDKNPTNKKTSIT